MRESSRETCICVTPMSRAISLLGPAAEEPQHQDATVPLAERAYDGGEHDPGLDGVGGLLSTPSRSPSVVLGVRADRAVERARGEAAVGGQRLHDVLDRLVEVPGELRGPRGPAEREGQLALGGADPGLQLLDPARRAHHPAVVAEVALHLAADRRDGVGREVVAAVGVELRAALISAR